MTGRKVITVEEAFKKAAYFCAYQERCHKEVEEKLYQALKSYFPKMSFTEFVNVGESENGAFGVVEYRKVGPSIADDITYNSFYSLGIALGLVFLYLLFSFRKWQFSAGAVFGNRTRYHHRIRIVLIGTRSRTVLIGNRCCLYRSHSNRNRVLLE